MPEFPTIKPGAIDLFVFDFTSSISSVGGGAITNVVLTCENSVDSLVQDPTPEARIIDGPIFDNTKASALCGRMIDNVIYTLTATATITGETLSPRTLILTGDVECTSAPDEVGDVVTIERFRKDFPTFADASQYQDDGIAFWIGIAVKQLNATRFTDVYTLAQELYVAHQITLERQANLIVLRGGVPLTFGPAASRSVGPVSVSFDFGIAIDQQAGYWNLTMYGLRLWSLIQMYGAGPVQV